MSMNIYAKRGDRVTYLDKNGYDHDRKQAAKAGITLGRILTVDFTDPGNCHTDVVFQEFPGERFNSVMFEDTE